MKHWSLILLLTGYLFATTDATAQDVAIYEQAGRYGLRAGETVICKARYQEIRPPKEGYFGGLIS